MVLAGTIMAAQEKPVYSGPTMSGEVTAGFVDNNVLSNPFVESIPGFTSSFYGTSFEINFSSTLSRSRIVNTSYDGVISTSRQVGYEFCLAFDFADLYDFEAATYETKVDAESSGYSLIQKMINWYDSHRRRFGLPDNPCGTAWPTTAYGAEGGRYQFIVGERVEPIGWVSWNDDKWADARALYTDIRKAILDAIETISPDVNTGGGNHINQFTYASLVAAKKALVLKEQEAYDAFFNDIYGESDDFGLDGIKARKAYLSVTGIADCLDLRLDFAGSKFSVGRLVGSPRAAQEDTGASLKAGLATGLVEGLSLSLRSDFVGGLSSTAEDYDTYTLEYDPGEPSWLGLGVDAAYDLSRFVPGRFVIGLNLLAPDLAERPLTLAASLSADYRLDGKLSLDLQGEFNALSWDERLVVDTPILAFAAGMDLSAEYLGIGGRLAAGWKSTGYGGDGGNDLSDSFDGISAQEDFETASASAAAWADFGIAYSPAAMTGLDLGRISAGANAFLYGANARLLGLGWYASITARLHDLCEIPLTLGLGCARYSNSDTGSFVDIRNWPVAGFLDGSTLSASLTWDVSDDISVILSAKDYDSGWKLDTERVLAVSASAKVSF
jgi:hypothetical protein